MEVINTIAMRLFKYFKLNFQNTYLVALYLIVYSLRNSTSLELQIKSRMALLLQTISFYSHLFIGKSYQSMGLIIKPR